MYVKAWKWEWLSKKHNVQHIAMLKVQEEQINKQWKASDKATWLEAKIERKWWGGKKDNGGIKKIPLNPKNPKLAFRN
jgi:hypothetical protein